MSSAPRFRGPNPRLFDQTARYRESEIDFRPPVPAGVKIVSVLSPQCRWCRDFLQLHGDDIDELVGEGFLEVRDDGGIVRLRDAEGSHLNLEVPHFFVVDEVPTWVGTERTFVRTQRIVNTVSKVDAGRGNLYGVLKQFTLPQGSGGRRD